MAIIRTRTPAGEPIVILPEAEFERLRELAEDAEDAAAHARVTARLASGEEELLTSDEVSAALASPTPLAFWRAKRGTTLEDLAGRVGSEPSALAAVERGDHLGTVHIYQKLAEALRVDIEDLVPSES